MAAVHTAIDDREPQSAEALSSRYSRVRAATVRLCAPLEREDYVVQSMPDASPIKWHLAHTSWFFEQFLLKPSLRGYKAFHPDYEYLFNSYYQSVGRMHARPQRGLLTRPTVQEVLSYREHVDEHMRKLLAALASDDKIAFITTLGINHEQQHQELMLTDVKHLFSCNPLLPAYRTETIIPAGVAGPIYFQSFDGGVREIGASGKDFCFDNETPRHQTLVEPYALADRLITNGEYLEFIRDGGYRRPELWLSDGWSLVNDEHWTRPIYWSEALDSEFTLSGPQPLHATAPVAHVSFFFFFFFFFVFSVLSSFSSFLRG